MDLIEQYYDRFVDLSFYDASNNLIAKLETPAYGRKPDILVKGTKIANSNVIETQVTITNLESNSLIYDSEWLIVSFGYSKLLSRRNALRLRVLWADVGKVPPDKQTVFHCIEANSDVSILETPVSFSFDKGATLYDVLRMLITKYNAAISAYLPSAEGSLRLASEPKSAISDLVLEQKFVVGDGDTLKTAMRKAERLIAVYDEAGNIFYPLSVLPSANVLHVYMLSDPNTIALRSKEDSQIDLSYVISASRNGPIFTVRTLFDPRVNVGDVIAIARSSLVAKRVGEGLTTVKDEARVAFRADVRIDFAFGTIEQNSMIMTGNYVW